MKIQYIGLVVIFVILAIYFFSQLKFSAESHPRSFPSPTNLSINDNQTCTDNWSSWGDWSGDCSCKNSYLLNSTLNRSRTSSCGTKEHQISYCVLGCEGKSVQLNCSDGDFVIHVLSAVFHNSSFCNSDKQKECSKDITPLVKLHFKNKKNHSMEVSTMSMGVDPCDNVNKALTVHYICAPPITVTPHPNISIGLLVAEGDKRDKINGAILSVHKFTPIEWPLHAYYPNKKKHPDGMTWMMGLPYNNKLKEDGRTIIYKEFPIEYTSQDHLAFDRSFWSNFTEDYLLFFHADSGMCKPPELPYDILDFFAFDYVGAPWPPSRVFQESTIYVGNGGFSIRNRTFMIDCVERGIKKEGIYIQGPEDYYFALCAQRFGRHLNSDIARYFAVETVPPHPEGALGFHGLCSWGKYLLSSEFKSSWLKKCPESEFFFGDNCTK